jgi:hypothetical protein
MVTQVIAMTFEVTYCSQDSYAGYDAGGAEFSVVSDVLIIETEEDTWHADMTHPWDSTIPSIDITSSSNLPIPCKNT